MSHTTQIYDFYRGGTFSLADAAVLLPTGSAWTATAQVRNAANDLVAALDVTLTLVTPAFTAASDKYSLLLECPAADTAEWDIEKLTCNVLFSDDSDPAVRIPSAPFVVNVLRPPTEPA